MSRKAFILSPHSPERVDDFLGDSHRDAFVERYFVYCVDGLVQVNSRRASLCSPREHLPACHSPGFPSAALLRRCRDGAAMGLPHSRYFAPLGV